MERGGNVMTKVVPNTRRVTVEEHIVENVLPGTEVHADMLPAYDKVGELGFGLKRINKKGTGRYVGDEGESVNAIENFWRHLKCSITGTHNNVGGAYLARYAKEFEYRVNRRMTPEVMKEELITRFPEMDRHGETRL